MPLRQGRHFLNIPGPNRCPSVFSWRWPDRRSITGGRNSAGWIGRCAKFAGRSSGPMDRSFRFWLRHGAWDATIVNTLSPGARVLMSETGHLATLWSKMAAQ